MVLLGIYGCGQAREDSAPSSSPRSAQGPEVIEPARFVKAAKAICTKANKERGRAGGVLLARRTKETGENPGLVGEFEMVQKVIAPSLSREIDRLEKIGLPRGHAYEAEALWQTLRTVLNEVEVEGLYAWHSAKLLRPFRNRAKMFKLEFCVVN
jgi:hypothetical protein